MAETVFFCAALGRIGFQPPLQDAIIAQEITTLADLLMFQKGQIKRLCKVIRERAVDPLEINMRQEQLLGTMRFWAQARARANLPLNAALFTLALAKAEAMKMVSALEETAEKEPAKVPANTNSQGGRTNTRGGKQQGRGRNGRFHNQHFTPGRGRGGRGLTSGRYNPRGRGHGARYVPYIQPQDWANMSQEEQREVLNNRGTLCHQVEIVDAALDQDQASQVSGITNPTAHGTHGYTPAVTASINQVSQSTSSQSAPFGGRAAYRQP